MPLTDSNTQKPICPPAPKRPGKRKPEILAEGDERVVKKKFTIQTSPGKENTGDSLTSKNYMDTPLDEQDDFIPGAIRTTQAQNTCSPNMSASEDATIEKSSHRATDASPSNSMDIDYHGFPTFTEPSDEEDSDIENEVLFMCTNRFEPDRPDCKLLPEAPSPTPLEFIEIAPASAKKVSFNSPQTNFFPTTGKRETVKPSETSAFVVSTKKY